MVIEVKFETRSKKPLLSFTVLQVRLPKQQRGHLTALPSMS